MKSRPMTSKDVLAMVEHYKSFNGELDGECFVCGKHTIVRISVNPDDGALSVQGGAVWIRDVPLPEYIEEDNKRKPVLCHELTVKCDECYGKDPVLRDQDTEVYARVVGYIRPVTQWNPGKKEEFRDRRGFKVDKGGE